MLAFPICLGTVTPRLPNLLSAFHQHPVFTWLQIPFNQGRKRKKRASSPSVV